MYRHSFGDSRSRFPNRPLSGSHFHRRSKVANSNVSTSMDLDLAVHKENHPVLMEEDSEEGQDEPDLAHQPSITDSEELEINEDGCDTLDEELSGSDDTMDSDDSFSKSCKNNSVYCQMSSSTFHTQVLMFT